MRKMVLRLIVAATTLIPLSVQAQVQRYDKEKTRALLLNLGQQPPKESLIIEGAFANPKAEAFVDFYRTKIYPRDEHITDFVMRYRTYRLLMDSASYRDEAEYKIFQQEWQKAAEEYNSFLVDQSYTEELKEWASLAQGLSGQLPDLARRLARERDLESFPEHLKPKLDEIELLEKEYELAMKDAPSNAKLEELTKARIELRRAFKAGEISFAEAQGRSNELLKHGGYHFIGYEAAQAKGDNLNRVAILRTELAKAKGFKTWAEYVLEMTGQGYEPAYRGPVQQREFLRQYITALAPLQRQLIEERIAELGLSGRRDTLRSNHMLLLTLPDLDQLQRYFPASKVTDIWEKTMLESGFSQANLAQILVDDQFRDGKNRTMAYMAGLLGPYTGYSTLDAKSLNFIEIPLNSPDWKPGFTYILQSYPGSIRDLETAFHEGGHALEKILKFKQQAADEAYGYVEVPSMTMERFMRDPQVVFNNTTPVNGQVPGIDEIRDLLENNEKNEIVTLLDMATQALFDTELWDYDYAQPGAQTFLQRVESLALEIHQLAERFPAAESPVPLFYSYVATTHFTSGNVRNIGYTYAEIASRMMSSFISDELEKLSGRRSWYQQPQLASIFADRFFSVGWKKLFPENIETITGRKFDPKTVVDEMAARLKGQNHDKKDACEKKLLQPEAEKPVKPSAQP